MTIAQFPNAHYIGKTYTIGVDTCTYIGFYASVYNFRKADGSIITLQPENISTSVAV